MSMCFYFKIDQPEYYLYHKDLFFITILNYTFIFVILSVLVFLYKDQILLYKPFAVIVIFGNQGSQ